MVDMMDAEIRESEGHSFDNLTLVAARRYKYDVMKY